jgi:hypothetical protein
MQCCTRRPVRISGLVAALVLLSRGPAHAHRTDYGLATRRVPQEARQEAIL